MLSFKKNKTTVNSVALKESWKETHSGMRFVLILYIGWRNLRLSRTRSILTIGGVALGIGIITFLLCLGFGIQRMIVNEVTKNNPQNVIDINNGSLDNFVALSNEIMDKIKSINGVTEIERRVNTGGKVILGESQTDVVIFGANQEYLDLAKVSYRSYDKKFSNDDPGLIISERLAKLIGFDNVDEAIGKTIKYNVALTKEVNSGASEEKFSEDTEAEIVGIVNDTDGTFMYISFNVLRDKFGIDLAQTGKVVVSDFSQFDNVKQQIEQMGFVTESINDLIKDINSFFDTVKIILIVFGIIIMSISVMGMLNTLSVSLLQRTKEIGILKALGTKRRDIFKMFVIESIIISFVGGVLGFLGGFGFAFVVNQLLIFLSKRAGVSLDYFIYVPGYFIVSIGGFIIFLGFFTGIMPAFRAAKIHALEALRYE